MIEEPTDVPPKVVKTKTEIDIEQLDDESVEQLLRSGSQKQLREKRILLELFVFHLFDPF